MATVQQAFELALQHHKAGRLSEAEALGRQILAVQPDHADALHLLGVIAHQAGHHEIAEQWIRRAILLNPNNAMAYGHLGDIYEAMGSPDEAIAQYRHALQLKPDLLEAINNLSIVLARQGRLDEAIAALRRVLELRPDFAEAHYNMGVALMELGQIDEAIVTYRRAIEFNPNHVAAHYNLGIACRKRGQLDEAIAAYRRTIELQPGHVGAHYNLGNVLKDRGQLDQSVVAYRRALELQPDYAEAHYNLGIVLNDRGQVDEAIAAYRRVLEIQPDFAEAHNNLGNALKAQGHLDESLAAFRQAMELKPDYAEARNNLGGALRELGRIDQAMVAYRRALAMKPDLDEAKFNCSILLLLRGDFEQGWPWYEARWKAAQTAERQFTQPFWDGGSVDGKRVLIHAEQGFGDSIQFIRYARLIAERGGEIVLECPRPLVNLFRSVKGVSAVVAAGDPLPPFDLHVPVLSQPLLFHTRIESIPAEIPYLFAESSRCAIWEQRLGGERARLRVGLAWAGDPQHRRTRIRDVSLKVLLPLLRVDGVEFFSLQVGHGSEQIRQVPAAAAIIDHTAQIQDFADTAALMGELDLIISVDTAVAHLAGALGRPVWTLVPFAPDWRWGLEREDTPWYSTMRLFRQPTVADWASVIQRVACDLERLAARREEYSGGARRRLDQCPVFESAAAS